MSEKVNFLKKYPLIPSIFFILFAWFCLHLITTCKDDIGNSKNHNPLIINELSVKSTNPDWELILHQQGLMFATARLGKFEFAYPQQIILQNDQTGSVRIYQTQNSQDEIQVTLVRQTSAPQERVVVKFRNKYYYFEKTNEQ
ncbi:MAG: hypothetical protein MUE85_11390 [Microscillaceae bacterium]|jgi:hypothetical protein|nr:hypothetical protein [Microscillaceae bacterium]